MIHFFSILTAEFFRYIVKFSKSGGTNFAKQFDPSKLFFHSMSYSSAAVADALMCKTTPPFDHTQAVLTRNERYFICFGSSNT